MHRYLARLFDLLVDLQREKTSPAVSLDRSIAAARQAHISARRALAIAMSEEARETARRTMLATKVDDLETRAVEALRAGREDLALQASEAIAAMRTDLNASELASKGFSAEVALARREVDAQRRRLSALDRGWRLARIGTALNAAKPDSPHDGIDSFADAEAALAQLVAENQDARFVRDEMGSPAEHLIERMSDAGFGEPVHVRASDVLARLRTSAGLQPQLIESNSNAR